MGSSDEGRSDNVEQIRPDRRVLADAIGRAQASGTHMQEVRWGETIRMATVALAHLNDQGWLLVRSEDAASGRSTQGGDS